MSIILSPAPHWLHPIVVILPEKPLPMARNFEIIDRLQTHVEPELFSRPGVYDGRKNMFMAFELPFGDTGVREVRTSSP